VYWPEEGTQQYGEVTVMAAGKEEYAEFTVRTWSVSVEVKDVLK